MGFINIYGGYMEIVLFLSIVISVICGLLVYFLFAKQNRDGIRNRFAAGLYDFLNFKSLILKGVLKGLYAITAIFLTIFGIMSIFAYNGGMIFLTTTIAGNIVARLIYELVMMFVTLVENTTEIKNQNMMLLDLEEFDEEIDEEVDEDSDEESEDESEE